MKTMKKILVSVIVPIYNAEQYLPKCLDSICRQDYTHLEILLIDDGSTDSSGKLCDAYAARDQRVRAIHKKNGGSSSSRECGVQQATGDYMMMVDADDWIDENCIDRCISALNRAPEADCVIFSYQKEYGERSIPVHVMAGDMALEGQQAEEKVYRRLYGLVGDELSNPAQMDNMGTCWGKLYRADVARKGRYFDTKTVGSAEDALFNMYALHGCDSIVYLDECFYHYRKGGSSLTNGYRAGFEKKWEVLFSTIRDIIAEKCLATKYTLALNNRIALSIVGIGLNERNNPNHSPTKKIAYLREQLSKSSYRTAVRTLDCSHMPVHWKVFFWCCKRRWAASVYALLEGMAWLMQQHL